MPSKPRILVAVYDPNKSQFYLKWLLDNNGGSNIEELNVTFLEYNFGSEKTFSKSNFLLNFVKNFSNNLEKFKKLKSIESIMNQILSSIMI